MSRAYAMEMEITIPDGISLLQEATLYEVYKREWEEDAGFRLDDKTIVFCANYSLYAGEGEEEAHRRIVAAVKTEIPDCSVTTRWTYLENLPYEEYTD